MVSPCARFPFPAALLLSLSLVLPATAPAQPLGSQFQVNTYTTGSQGFYSWGVSVAADADGDFVVVWSGEGPGYDSTIFGQRFNSAGVAQGAEFVANTYTTGNQGYGGVVAAAADADGDFVVVWGGEGSGDQNGVFGQRFDSAGSAQGAQFLVNTYTTGNQGSSTGRVSVAAAADGDFVVVWSGAGSGDSFGVFGRRFDSAGAAQGGEFLVNSYTTSTQGSRYDGLSVSADDDGNFVVVWSGYGSGDDDRGIFGRRFDSAGTAQASEFMVNTYTTGYQYKVSVAADADGDFVVAWGGNGAGSYYNYYDVQAQRFSSAGVAQGGEFLVNTYTPGNQTANLGEVAVDTDADGDFVIVWWGFGPGGFPGEHNDVFGQRFDGAGVAQGAEFVVNTYTTGDQGLGTPGLAVAADADGSFVVVWGSQYGPNPGNYNDVFGQRYASITPPPPPIPALTGRGALVLGTLLAVALGWSRRRMETRRSAVRRISY
jgi:hypothetical protein